MSAGNQRARGVCVEAQHLVGMIREKVLNSLRHVMPVVIESHQRLNVGVIIPPQMSYYEQTTTATYPERCTGYTQWIHGPNIHRGNLA